MNLRPAFFDIQNHGLHERPHTVTADFFFDRSRLITAFICHALPRIETRSHPQGETAPARIRTVDEIPGSRDSTGFCISSVKIIYILPDRADEQGILREGGE